MADIVSQPWFWPAVIVSVGLPLVLIGLTEFHNALARRGSRAAPIVLMVRNYLVPVAGILVLHQPARRVAGRGHLAARSIWTIFGLLVIVVTINAINHLVFHRGEKGSWRDRFPTIFSDLIRFVFIVARHRGGVLVGVGCRCRGRLRRARHHLDRRRASRCRTRSDRSSRGCS